MYITKCLKAWNKKAYKEKRGENLVAICGRQTSSQPGMSEEKEVRRTSVPLVLIFLFVSFFPSSHSPHHYSLAPSHSPSLFLAFPPSLSLPFSPFFSHLYILIPRFTFLPSHAPSQPPLSPSPSPSPLLSLSLPSSLLCLNSSYYHN